MGSISLLLMKIKGFRALNFRVNYQWVNLWKLQWASWYRKQEDPGVGHISDLWFTEYKLLKNTNYAFVLQKQNIEWDNMKNKPWGSP